jgi:hypothetical protein
MAPRKLDKSAGESTNPNTYVMSDTSSRAIDTVRTWTQVFDILEHDLINFPEDFGDKVSETHATKLGYIAQSELQKIAMWSRFMPYNDMIGWALENVDISTRSIYNSQRLLLGLFNRSTYK